MDRQVKPRCPYYGACGGCQLQHLEYHDQLVLKTGIVREALAKEGVGEIGVRPTIGMEDPWFYRNKIQFPIRQQNGQLQMGYFRKRTHEVVNIKECYIQNPFLTEIAQIARKIFAERGLTAYDEKTGKGLLRHFIGRSAEATGELLLGIVVNAKGLPAGFTVADEIKKQERLMHRQVARHQDYPRFETRPKIVGIVQNSNLARGNVIMGQFDTTLLGIPFMREQLGRFKFKVGLHSFLQVNPTQTVKLYNLIKKYAELSGTEKVVDAYAGIGTIAFWLSEKAEGVVGIEEREEAVKDAKQNIALNKLANVTMVAGLAEKEFPKRADVAVLDPPRGGCSEQALKRIVRAEPRLIIYVSCNPTTLARDLKALVNEDYQIAAIQPVDMFPQTEHVEVVVKLSRGGRSFSQ
ncbi:MAG: 23S rRNA (uracil(1939)-C(5))-methyltransferase RlmD [Candidatus Margulisiibacteriota bacterium]